VEGFVTSKRGKGGLVCDDGEEGVSKGAVGGFKNTSTRDLSDEEVDDRAEKGGGRHRWASKSG
jgi:hypothetical protein